MSQLYVNAKQLISMINHAIDHGALVDPAAIKTIDTPQDYRDYTRQEREEETRERAETRTRWWQNRAIDAQNIARRVQGRDMLEHVPAPSPEAVHVEWMSKDSLNQIFDQLDRICRGRVAEINAEVDRIDSLPELARARRRLAELTDQHAEATVQRDDLNRIIYGVSGTTVGTAIVPLPGGIAYRINELEAFYTVNPRTNFFDGRPTLTRNGTGPAPSRTVIEEYRKLLEDRGNAVTRLENLNAEISRLSGEIAQQRVYINGNPDICRRIDLVGDEAAKTTGLRQQYMQLAEDIAAFRNPDAKHTGAAPGGSSGFFFKDIKQQAKVERDLAEAKTKHEHKKEEVKTQKTKLDQLRTQVRESEAIVNGTDPEISRMLERVREIRTQIAEHEVNIATGQPAANAEFDPEQARQEVDAIEQRIDQAKKDAAKKLGNSPSLDREGKPVESRYGAASNDAASLRYNVALLEYEIKKLEAEAKDLETDVGKKMAIVRDNLVAQERLFKEALALIGRFAHPDRGIYTRDVDINLPGDKNVGEPSYTPTSLQEALVRGVSVVETTGAQLLVNPVAGAVNLASHGVSSAVNAWIVAEHADDNVLTHAEVAKRGVRDGLTHGTTYGTVFLVGTALSGGNPAGGVVAMLATLGAETAAVVLPDVDSSKWFAPVRWSFDNVVRTVTSPWVYPTDALENPEKHADDSNWKKIPGAVAGALFAPIVDAAADLKQSVRRITNLKQYGDNYIAQGCVEQDVLAENMPLVKQALAEDLSRNIRKFDAGIAEATNNAVIQFNEDRGLANTPAA